MLRTAEDLRSFLQFMGWTFAKADEIAGKSGRTASYLRKTRPAKPSAEYLDALAAASGLAPTWKEIKSLPSRRPYTAPGSDPPSPLGMRGMVPGAGRRLFRILGVAGAAAAPVQSGDPDPDDWEDFPDDLYHPERFCIRVTGDSMSPRIEHGDFVLVHPHPNPATGLLVVAHNSVHEYVCKTLQRDEQRRPQLVPINRNGYDVLEPDGEWKIDGFVVAIKRRGGRGKGMEIWDDAGLRP